MQWEFTPQKCRTCRRPWFPRMTFVTTVFRDLHDQILIEIENPYSAQRRIGKGGADVVAPRPPARSTEIEAEARRG